MGERAAAPPAWTTFDGPLKKVLCRRYHMAVSLPGGQVSASSSLGTTAQPRRTPVKPADLEKLFSSMAQLFAPGTS